MRVSAPELMALHIEALFTADAAGRLQFVNEPWASQGHRTPAPRFFLGRTAAGHSWRFRSDLPLRLIEQLTDLCRDEPVTAVLDELPKHLDIYRHLLAADAPIQRTWAGPAYRLPRNIRPARPVVRITAANGEVLGADFADFREELATAQPFFGLVQAGQVVSICRSVRIASRGHEAGVETLAAFRGQGYAAAVVAGWAAAVSALGCLPLYSTAWENTASQGVAGKLGALHYGVDFHIT